MKQKVKQQERKRGQKSYKTENNKQMAIVTPALSIITLNVNRLNSPIKRHRVAECILKTNKKKAIEYIFFSSTHGTFSRIDVYSNRKHSFQVHMDTTG